MCGFFFFILRIIALQCCVVFCCTMKWIPCMYTHFPSLLDLPPTPPTSHPTHLRHHRAPSWASYATQGVPTSYLFYAWWCIYVSPNLSVHPGLPSPAVSTGLFCRSASLFQFIHVVMQSAPLSISGTFASFQTETPDLLMRQFSQGISRVS